MKDLINSSFVKGLTDAMVEVHPWEPDDHGGGFACIEVAANIYSEKELDKLISVLLKQRKALRRQLRKAHMEEK